MSSWNRLGLFALLALCSVGVSCAKPCETPFAVRYFKRFAANYQIPFTPVEPMTEQEALASEHYLKAQYNDKCELHILEFFHDGNVTDADEYLYYANGDLKTRYMRYENGTVIVWKYDESGKASRESIQ